MSDNLFNLIANPHKVSRFLCNSDNEILYIKSKLVMSRPLIYLEKNNDLDFFHG